jgi:hypothetical protein
VKFHSYSCAFYCLPDNSDHPVNNDLKMIFAYNTNLKELKTNLNIHSNYYFDFVTRDIMLERENKEMQYSGNLCYVYIFQCS